MKAGIYTIEIEQGSTYDKLFTVKRNGAAEDLSGFEGARMQIRRNPGATVIFDTADDPSYMVLDGNAGTIHLHIPANITKDFKFTDGTYDIELYTNDESNVQKYLKGKVILEKETTR